MTPKRQRVAPAKSVPSSTPITPAKKKRASVGTSNGKPASKGKRGRPSKKPSDPFDFDDEDENSAPVATPLRLLSAKKTIPNGTSDANPVINKCPLDLEPIVYSSEDSQPESVSAHTNGTNGTADGPSKFCASCFLEIEEEEEHISCSGPCLLSFHTKCLKNEAKKEEGVSQEMEITSEWKCIECTTGQHKCFVCSKHSDTVEKCTVKDCGRFYHVDCLTRYPHKKTESSFTCPLHFCLTCFNDHDEDNVYRSVKNRLLQCVKCPTAYHFLDDCLAAGSAVIIPKMFIECPEHLSRKSFKVINVSYCFACLEGGNIICCESCPAAFHETCLDFKVPSGPFYCGACMKRKQVVYGETVWVKLGGYRWWPARVIPPANIPDNLMRKKWDKGQFVVQFAGSLDYYWVDKGRVFPYMEGDCEKQHNKPAGKSKMNQLYQQALIDAPKFFESFRKARSVALAKKVKSSAPYSKIQVNRPIGNVAAVMKAEKEKEKKKAKEGKEAGQTWCTCQPKSDAPCSSDTECENRLVNVECNKDNCKASPERCHNRRFKKRSYVSTTPFNTGDRGWGLKADEDIKKGTFVIEYVGELIDDEELQRRLAEKLRINDRNFYFLTLDKDRIIDAGPAGNHARFMNHSCSPNCMTQKWVVDGSNRVGLFAIRDIAKGEELTFNYNLVARGGEKTRCHCGADDCIKFIGERQSKPSSDKTAPKATNGINKRKGRNNKRKPVKKNIPEKIVVNGGGDAVAPVTVNDTVDTDADADTATADADDPADTTDAAAANADADADADPDADADADAADSQTKVEPVSPSSHQEE